MSFTPLYKLLVPFVAHDSQPTMKKGMLVRANRLFRSADKRRRLWCARLAKENAREKLLADIRKREREREKSIRGGCKIARSSVGRSPVFIHDFARAMLAPLLPRVYHLRVLLCRHCRHYYRYR